MTVVGTVPGGDQTVSGTGFFITDTGYILTNNHVVEGTDEVRIILSDGTEQTAGIVGTDLYSDIAVLKNGWRRPGGGEAGELGRAQAR